MVAKQAQKRVGLASAHAQVTWDHRKLGGTY